MPDGCRYICTAYVSIRQHTSAYAFPEYVTVVVFQMAADVSVTVRTPVFCFRVYVLVCVCGHVFERGVLQTPQKIEIRRIIEFPDASIIEFPDGAARQ